MDEDFKDELFNVIESLLKYEMLSVKKINGKDLKGSEYLEYMLQYYKIFQSDEIPQTQSIYESTVEKQNLILIDMCITKYEETVYKNRDLITNIAQFPILHNMSKSEAMLMFKESKKMGNDLHEVKFKKILSDKIEEKYQKWSDRQEKNLKEIELEVEKTRLALEEKQKLELEYYEKEKKATEELRRLDRLYAEKEIEKEKYLKEKEVAEVKLKAEQDRLKTLELEKIRNDSDRQFLKMMLQAEVNRNQNRGNCNIL